MKMVDGINFEPFQGSGVTIKGIAVMGPAWGKIYSRHYFEKHFFDN